MNSFLISTMALCALAAQCALAQYGPSAYNNNGANNGAQQRKLAPTPQLQLANYGHQQQPQYQASASQHQQQAQYQQQPQSYAPSKPATYARAAAPSYAAPRAAKYEEPYYPPMPFAWGYDINDGYGGAQFHKESGDEYGKRTGSYGYTDAYGIYRQVDYVADEHGFRATVKTNEPGTANEAPADVEWHAYEPPSNHYAGNQQQSYGAQQNSYAPAAAAAPSPANYQAPRPAPMSPRAGYGQASAPLAAARPSYQPSATRAYPTRNQANQYESQAYGASQNVPTKQQMGQRASY